MAYILTGVSIGATVVAGTILYQWYTYGNSTIKDNAEQKYQEQISSYREQNNLIQGNINRYQKENNLIQEESDIIQKQSN